jgi:hypothetical protein
MEKNLTKEVATLTNRWKKKKKKKKTRFSKRIKILERFEPISQKPGRLGRV